MGRRIMPCNFPECENLRIPDDFEYPDDIGNGLNTEKACCYAFIAECLSCSAGMKVDEYCKQNPDIVGCEDTNTNDPVPDRSNARIDYEPDLDFEVNQTVKHLSDQREGKDLDITQNTCSPNCKSFEPKTKMATSEWCLLECNNAGASRCLPDWCECY